MLVERITLVSSPHAAAAGPAAWPSSGRATVMTRERGVGRYRGLLTGLLLVEFASVGQHQDHPPAPLTTETARDGQRSEREIEFRP